MSELIHVDLCRVSAGELLLAAIALGFSHCWASPSRREHGYWVWHLSWTLLILLLGKAWTPQVPLGRPGLTTAPNVPADLSPNLTATTHRQREGCGPFPAVPDVRANRDGLLRTLTSPATDVPVLPRNVETCLPRVTASHSENRASLPTSPGARPPWSRMEVLRHL